MKRLIKKAEKEYKWEDLTPQQQEKLVEDNLTSELESLEEWYMRQDGDDEFYDVENSYSLSLVNGGARKLYEGTFYFKFDNSASLDDFMTVHLNEDETEIIEYIFKEVFDSTFLCKNNKLASNCLSAVEENLTNKANFDYIVGQFSDSENDIDKDEIKGEGLRALKTIRTYIDDFIYDILYKYDELVNEDVARKNLINHYKNYGISEEEMKDL